MASAKGENSSTRSPQEAVDDLWSTQGSAYGVTHRISPSSQLLYNPPVERYPSHQNLCAARAQAVQKCIDEVNEIAARCDENNQNFIDTDFDVYDDFSTEDFKFIKELDVEETSTTNPKAMSAAVDEDGPKSVHRVRWIFKDPQFTSEGGYSSSDIHQGSIGNCWFIAGVASIADDQELMNFLCAAQRQDRGIYGFVFFVLGAWCYVIVDDQLHQKHQDFARNEYDPEREKEAKHRAKYQTGSDSLYYSRCRNERNTWLPLLVKAVRFV